MSAIHARMPERISERKLTERVKELACLYAVARIAQRPDDPLPDLVRAVVAAIPQGFQFPEAAMVHVRLDEQEYGAAGSAERLFAELTVDGEARGRIAVSYSADLDPEDQPLFLPEEQQLLDKLAQELSLIIERHERRAQQALMHAHLRSNDRLAILGELTAGIAHELNTPLGNVLGYAELLKENETEPERKSDLQRIIDSALIGREIVKKLMYFSCEMPAQFQPTDVEQAIRGTVRLIDRRLQERDVRITWDLAQGLPELRLDTVQFAQVITNIILNAVGAMPSGGRITIASRERDGKVEITITDTGTGIAEENLKRVFQPFFTTKAVGEGTGLGLAVVHGIMKAHQGDVTVSSEIGVGTTFTLTFPMP